LLSASGVVGQQQRPASSSWRRSSARRGRTIDAALKTPNARAIVDPPRGRFHGFRHAARRDPGTSVVVGVLPAIKQVDGHWSQREAPSPDIKIAAWVTADLAAQPSN